MLGVKSGTARNTLPAAATRLATEAAPVLSEIQVPIGCLVFTFSDTQYESEDHKQPEEYEKIRVRER
jgi:hypothetical protein